MAVDSVPITAGVGTPVATDQLAGGEDVQFMKLLDGTAASENRAIVTAAGALKVDPSAVTQPVSVAALPLPSGAATAVNQTTEITGLAAILSELQAKTEPADQQHVVVDSSALPSGAATSAKQDTGNASLASIDGKMTAVNTGAVVLAAGAATIGALTANQSVNQAQVAGTATAVNSGNASAGVQRVVLATDQPALTTAFPQSAKGTQGAMGLAVQDLKDAGRTAITLMFEQFGASSTAETVVSTLQSSSNFGTPSTVLSAYRVTAGKKLRITFMSIQLTTVTGNTTNVITFVRLRAEAGAAATISSFKQFFAALGSFTTANSATNVTPIAIGEGMEFSSQDGICFTVETPSYNVTTAAPKISMNIVGYEY